MHPLRYTLQKYFRYNLSKTHISFPKTHSKLAVLLVPIYQCIVQHTWVVPRRPWDPTRAIPLSCLPDRGKQVINLYFLNVSQIPSFLFILHCLDLVCKNLNPATSILLGSAWILKLLLTLQIFVSDIDQDYWRYLYEIWALKNSLFWYNIWYNIVILNMNLNIKVKLDLNITTSVLSVFHDIELYPLQSPGLTFSRITSLSSKDKSRNFHKCVISLIRLWNGTLHLFTLKGSSSLTGHSRLGVQSKGPPSVCKL